VSPDSSDDCSAFDMSGITQPMIQHHHITEHHNPQLHFCYYFMYQGPTYQDKDSYNKHNTALPCWLPETTKYMKSNLGSHLTNKMSAISSLSKPQTSQELKNC